MSTSHTNEHPRMRKSLDTQPIQPDTYLRLMEMLEERYPDKCWRVVEVCPNAVIKTIDNERDARATIANLEIAKLNADGKPVPPSPRASP